jgi:hypothetical protein
MKRLIKISFAVNKGKSGNRQASSEGNRTAKQDNFQTLFHNETRQKQIEKENKKQHTIATAVVRPAIRGDKSQNILSSLSV